jgi:hypothetical protein
MYFLQDYWDTFAGATTDGKIILVAMTTMIVIGTAPFLFAALWILVWIGTSVYDLLVIVTKRFQPPHPRDPGRPRKRKFRGRFSFMHICTPGFLRNSSIYRILRTTRRFPVS